MLTSVTLVNMQLRPTLIEAFEHVTHVVLNVHGCIHLCTPPDLLEHFPCKEEEAFLVPKHVRPVSIVPASA